MHEIDERTSKHLSGIARLMPMVIRFFLLSFYNVYVKSNTLWTSSLRLHFQQPSQTVLPLQKEMLKLAHFKSQRSSTEELFESSEVLSMYDV